MLTIAGCFSLALQIFLLLFKFCLQELPALLSTSAVLLGSPAGSAGLVLCVHRAGGERQTWTCLSVLLPRAQRSALLAVGRAQIALVDAVF